MNDELRIPLNNKENISNKVTSWSNTLSNVKYPSEKLVKDTIDSLPTYMLDLIYPVGAIYMSVNSTSPSLLFGGRWVQISQGRTIIGQGTGTDSNSEQQTFANGDTGGEYNHTLSTNEIPSHTHNSISLTGSTRIQQYNGSASSTTGIISQSNNNYNIGTTSGSNFGSTTITVDATHTHDSVGGGQSHNNIQPYFVCYIWKRIEDYDYIVNTVSELTDALTNVSEGESIYINSGNYTLSEQYSLPSCKIIGNNATLVETGLVFDQNTTSPINISGITFDGNNVQNMRTFIDLDFITVDVHIYDCTFTNKRADWNGDIICIHNSSADHTIEIDHCTFTGDNYCKGYGHSKGSIIYFGNDGHPDAYNISIHHNIFNHNENVGDSGNLYNGRAICFIDATFHNCIAYCNTYVGSGDTNDGITESQCSD